jgi:hypothetical protein
LGRVSAMQIIAKSVIFGLTLMPASAFAGVWSQSEIDAAVATIEVSYFRSCADGFGGEFLQRVDQRDLNGDGVNELIVHTATDGASGCIGRVGPQIDLLIADGRGGWQRNLGFDTHSLNYLNREPGDWPDIELTGPGFCFPIWRYHDGEYGIWKTCENGSLVYAEGVRDGAVPASEPTLVAGVHTALCRSTGPSRALRAAAGY